MVDGVTSVKAILGWSEQRVDPGGSKAVMERPRQCSFLQRTIGHGNPKNVRGPRQITSGRW